MKYRYQIKKIFFIKKRKIFKKQIVPKRSRKKNICYLLILKKNYKKIKKLLIMKKNIRYLMKKKTLKIKKKIKCKKLKRYI